MDHLQPNLGGTSVHTAFLLILLREGLWEQRGTQARPDQNPKP